MLGQSPPHPRLPLSLPDLRSAGESPAASRAREQEVKALSQAAQQERKTALERSRVDTTFQVGDPVRLRTAELLDAAEKIGKLRPRWGGPFRVIALAGPKTYTLPFRADSATARPSMWSVSSPTMPARTNRTRTSRRPGPGGRGRGGAAARSSGAGFTSLCDGRGTTRRMICGSRQSTSRGLRNTRRLSLAVPWPAGRQPLSSRGPPAQGRAGRRRLRQKPRPRWPWPAEQ